MTNQAAPGPAFALELVQKMPVQTMWYGVCTKLIMMNGRPRAALEFLRAVTNFGDPARPMIPRILRSLPTRRQAIAPAKSPVMADDDRKRRDSGGPGTAVITKTKPTTKRPNLYRVLILNDDYTPMEFVVHVLERFFNKDREAATRIMLHVHHHGIGECGIFTYEVAETKVTQVMDFARKHHHPLQCVMEKK
jgi:ATP-dependent Clp protease adaptor protein ClpS